MYVFHNIMLYTLNRYTHKHFCNSQMTHKECSSSIQIVKGKRQVMSSVTFIKLFLELGLSKESILLTSSAFNILPDTVEGKAWSPIGMGL